MVSKCKLLTMFLGGVLLRLYGGSGQQRRDLCIAGAAHGVCTLPQLRGQATK